MTDSQAESYNAILTAAVIGPGDVVPELHLPLLTVDEAAIYTTPVPSLVRCRVSMLERDPHFGTYRSYGGCLLIDPDGTITASA